MLPFAAGADATVLTAVIAGVALVTGAALAALGSVRGARIKLDEVRLSHRQQLESAHLETAREHVDSLYLPLSR